MIKQLLDRMGYKIVKTAHDIYRTDNIQDKEFQRLLALCRTFTMTGTERMYALYNAVRYIAQNNIPGDFAECGVWRGGSAMLMAHTLLAHGISDRKIYLYDTYEGMSAPSENDVDIKGASADQLLKDQDKQVQTSVWCYADLADVTANMASTGYPMEHIILVKGMVEDTIPAQSPASALALLRLDTDWYESTLHELEHLYPILNREGVLIIDDYGHWQGCKKAVDEYFTEKKIWFNRIDYTGIAAIKLD
jgi:O-methyltransferase